MKHDATWTSTPQTSYMSSILNVLDVTTLSECDIPKATVAPQFQGISTTAHSRELLAEGHVVCHSIAASKRT